MSHLDHVTVHMESSEALHSSTLTALLAALGFHEVEPDRAIELDWNVRWFEPTHNATILHLVAADDDPSFPDPVPSLSHICIAGVGADRFEMAVHSEWCEHYRSGSGRCWLSYRGLRIEVRP